MISRNGLKQMSIFNRVLSQKSKEVDPNTALQQLDAKRDCQVTFKDIWQDYRHFKSAYYYHQHPNIAEIQRRPENQVDVDMKKFSLPQLIWDSFFYGNSQAPKFSPTHTFSTFAQMTAAFLLIVALSTPVRKYYHYDDPLNTGAKGSDGDSLDSQATIKAGLEKAKYQRRQQVD